MGVLGWSLIAVSVVYVLVFPIGLPGRMMGFWRGFGGAIAQGPKPVSPASSDPQHEEKEVQDDNKEEDAVKKASSRYDSSDNTSITNRKAPQRDSTMPPPPLPPSVIQPPSVLVDSEVEEQTTPKAKAERSSVPVPSFSLSEEPSPAAAPKPTAPSFMPPPPRPSPVPNRLPQFPAANSAQRARGPLPNRGPNAPSSSSLTPPSNGLAPPPTHSSKPAKPNRKVLLAPGRSPLDWARVSGPASDLRGVPASTPYLRVTPSMLKKQTGRKGKDAWMGLNGKVYNITPYAEYHPGGVPELMRGAGRDGTKLFGEIHPWVNYETMLSSCLIGLMVDEPEGNLESEMDQMD